MRDFCWRFGWLEELRGSGIKGYVGLGGEIGEME